MHRKFARGRAGPSNGDQFDQEIAIVQREVGGERGEMDLVGAALAVGVIEEEAVVRVVDDAIAGVSGCRAEVEFR